MRGEASSDVFKTWLYAAASVLLGAWLAPLLYNAGKALAEVSSMKQTNGPLEWLADVCRKTDFPAFFVASLCIAAAILFIPFVEWLRGGKPAAGGRTWSLRLPDGARAPGGGQRLRYPADGWRQGILGFLGVTMLFLFLASILAFSGIFEWRDPEETVARLLMRGLTAALALAVLQEILFRGIAMGIFLRAMRPAAALGMCAVLFALVHFLNPPAGLGVDDPDASGTGFELLREIAALFSDPRAILGRFAPLLALGGLLAYARWRTASLCLPIGLHTGWIFIHDFLDSVTASPSVDSLVGLLSGASLHQGLVPFVGVLFIGMLTYHLTRADDPTDTPA